MNTFSLLSMTISQSNTFDSVQTDRPAKTLELVSDTLAFGVAFAITLTIVQRGFGFLRGILFCRLMTEQELGQWSMVYSFLMLLAPFAVLGLPGCFGRFVEHYLQRGQLATFIRRISVISGFLTLGLAMCMFAAPEWFSSFVFRSSQYVGAVNAMAFALVFVTANNFLSTLMESLRQVRRATLMRFVTGITFAIFGTALIAFWQDGTVAATIGFGVACAIGLVPGITFLARHNKLLADDGESLTHMTMWKRIAPFALWLWAANFVTNMFEVSDRYMLIHWSDSSVEASHGFVGQYHSGRVLPLLLVGIAVVLDGILLPYATALWERNKTSEARSMIKLAVKVTSFAFTITGIGIVLCAPILFDSVFEGRYDDGLAVLPITLLYCIWFSLINLLSVYMLIVEKGKWLFGVISFGLLSNLLLNVLLIPHFGLWGAVIATTISMLVAFWAVVAANHAFGLRMDAGIGISAFVPVIVMLNPFLGFFAVSGLVAVSLCSNLVFDQKERSLATAQFGSILQKIRSRLK